MVIFHCYVSSPGGRGVGHFSVSVLVYYTDLYCTESNLISNHRIIGFAHQFLTISLPHFHFASKARLPEGLVSHTSKLGRTTMAKLCASELTTSSTTPGRRLANGAINITLYNHIVHPIISHKYGYISHKYGYIP